MNKLGAFQVIAVFGIIFSVAAHIILFLIDKHVKNFWLLYPTWMMVFIIGYFIKKYVKMDDHHH